MRRVLSVLLLGFIFNPSGSVKRLNDKLKQHSNGNILTEKQHRLSPPPGNWFRPSVPSEDQCIDSADVRGNTIIRTNASRAAGAVFIDSSTVRSSHECVAKCCSVSSCNLAIVDSKFDPAKCFLFDCKHPTVCEFTSFNGYSSISLPRGSAPVPPPESHVRRVNIPSPRVPPPPPPATTASTPMPISTISTITTSYAGIQESDLDSWRRLVADDGSEATKERVNRPTTVSPGILGDVIKMLQLSKTASKGIVNPPAEAVMTTAASTSTPHLLTTTTVQVSCRSAYEVHCADMDGCVALNDVCDGFAQCGDASDENADVCQVVRGRPDFVDERQRGKGGDGDGQGLQDDGEDGDGGGVGDNVGQAGKANGQRPHEKTSGGSWAGVQSTVKEGSLDAFPTPLSNRLSGKKSSQDATSAFLASSYSSSSPRLRKPSPSKTNPGLMEDEKEMTRQLDAMTTTTTTPLQTPARRLPTYPAASDANVSSLLSTTFPLRPESSSDDDDDDNSDEKQKISAPSVNSHRSHFTNSSSGKVTTMATVSATTSKADTISQHGVENPLTSDRLWQQARAGRAFVRRNASVALGCGLILFIAFVVFAAVKLKTMWLPSLRARGRRGNLQNREADYLINGMYL